MSVAGVDDAFVASPLFTPPFEWTAEHQAELDAEGHVLLSGVVTAPATEALLQAAQRRLALGLGLRSGGLLGLRRVDADVVAVVGARVVGLRQPIA